MADVSDLNPEFASRLDAFRAALTKAKIANTIVSGYRSPEEQSQLYANYQAKQAGRPLPFPTVNQGSIAAPPWQSFHNYGLAADVTTPNPADYARMWSMAPQFGLTALGQKDIDHFQLAGNLADDIAQYNLAGWRPASQPAPAQGAIAYSGPPAGQRNPALAARGPDFYATAMQHESGGKNIPNAAGGWGAAGGYYQFTPPTYAGIRAAHPELNLPENIQNATQDQQTAAYHQLVSQNVQALQGANLPVNDKNVFMASFLGGGGATKFLTAMNQNPNASAADLFPNEAKANPTVFFANGQPRSLNQVFALQTGKFGTGNTTGFGPNATAVASAAPGTTLNSPPLAAGGPGAPAAPGQPGAAQGNWMTKLASSLKPQGQDKGGSGGGGDDQPQPMQLAQAPPAQPVGGQMMIGAGGQNTLGRSVAGQQLAQQGFMMQPSLAANAMGANIMRPPVPSTLQSTIQPMAPGAATGMLGLPGTTLNSPSQLQMALMTGAMNPYDLYGGGAYGAQFGST